ncbi:metallophosphoesterase family protein [Cohnella yongneupensis]|uniref:Metallophosphoesterase family protein n=1 Tax=Cohnella yongneupensis TaxID=425006 RepID=A0ABW0R130_9BACL
MKQLTLRADGSFKIVQFTDLHWNNGEATDLRTRALMERVVAAEKPDFIVFTGDVIDSSRCRDPERSFRDALSVAEDSGIPWAAIFGNHDSESNVTREQLMRVQLSMAGTVAKRGPTELEGVGNFVLPVSDVDGRLAAALYCFDSGSYSDHVEAQGYGWIRERQLGWFRKEAEAFRLSNGGIPLPSLAFLHIPFPEYRDLWNGRFCYGHRYEKVGCPPVNSGLFAAMLDTDAIRGVFCGHDHINDYTGELYGIRLSYGRATGYSTYGRWLFQRGARVIRLRKGKPFDTWLRLANGSKVTQARKHWPTWYSKA